METMPNMKLIASGGLFWLSDETMDNQYQNGFMIFKKKPLMISVINTKPILFLVLFLC